MIILLKIDINRIEGPPTGRVLIGEDLAKFIPRGTFPVLDSRYEIVEVTPVGVVD